MKSFTINNNEKHLNWCVNNLDPRDYRQSEDNKIEIAYHYEWERSDILQAILDSQEEQKPTPSLKEERIAILLTVPGTERDDKGGYIKWKELPPYGAQLDGIVEFDVLENMSLELFVAFQAELREKSQRYSTYRALTQKYKDDASHPKHLLGFAASTSILVEIAEGRVSAEVLAKQELANRGMGKDGKWCGFEEAEKAWSIDGFLHFLRQSKTYVES